MTRAAVAALLAAAATAVAPGPAYGARRLASRPGRRGARRHPAPGSQPRRLGALAVAGVTAAGAGFAGPAGAVVAAAAAVAARHLAARLPSAADRARERRRAADVPLAIDVLAACLLAGSPPARAVAAVATAFDGPLATELREVARALAIGVPAETAWRPVLRSPQHDPLHACGIAMVRAEQSGASPVGGLLALADGVRRSARSAGEAAARRAGVLALIPLLACHLPAFVLLGVVPLIAGVAGGLATG